MRKPRSAGVLNSFHFSAHHFLFQAVECGLKGFGVFYKLIIQYQGLLAHQVQNNANFNLKTKIKIK